MNIRTASLFVALSAATLPATAAAFPGMIDVPPPAADIPAIQAWAEQHSFGGCSVDVFKSGEAEVVAVQRSFTSGLLTSALVVFVRIDDHFEPGLVFRTVTGYMYRLVQDGDYVHVRNTSGKELSGFSISSIGQDDVAWKGRAKPDAAKPDAGREAAKPGVAPRGGSQGKKGKD
jgi:hypothetical protein